MYLRTLGQTPHLETRRHRGPNTDSKATEKYSELNYSPAFEFHPADPNTFLFSIFLFHKQSQILVANVAYTDVDRNVLGKHIQSEHRLNSRNPIR